MNNTMYKEVILESSIPYANIKKIEKDGNIQYKFLEVNNAFCELGKNNKEILLNGNVIELYGGSVIRDFYTKFKKECDNKYVMYGFSEVEDKRYNIEVYTLDEIDFHVLFTEVDHSSTQLNTILKKSPFISWIMDLDGKYIDVNETFLQYAQQSYNEVVGKTHFEVWKSERAEEAYRQDKIVVEKNDVILFNETIIVNNKERFFETSRWPCIVNNKIVAVIGISIEITDKLKLKEVIRNTEQNFLDMANNIDELIIIQDHEKALYVSPYFEKLYGFKPDCLYEDIESWFKYWDEVEFIEKRKKFNSAYIENNLIKVVKEGRGEQWIQSKFVPILDDIWNVTKKIGILKDVTEEKHIDNKLQELRMEFFSNLSHEIRTPINQIMNSLQLINLKLPKENKIYIDKYLNIIKQNSLRLVRLVNNLIDSNKIDSGAFNYNPENADIISFIENIVDSVVDFVEKNNLEIIFDTDIEEKIIAFDLNHIERIVFNLISNAIKFNKPNGKIEVSISTKDNIKISIRDTGLGIPKNKVKRIFERFEQVNKYSRREREGSGIGLALVKALVEMQGGSIHLNTKLGEGSEFVVILPDILAQQISFNEVTKENGIINRVNRMEVEFSDIYI